MDFNPILSDVRKYLRSGKDHDLQTVVDKFKAYSDGDFISFFGNVLRVLPNDLSQNVINNKVSLPIVSNPNFNKSLNPNVPNSSIACSDYNYEDVPLILIQKIINEINKNITERTKDGHIVRTTLKSMFSDVNWL